MTIEKFAGERRAGARRGLIGPAFGIELTQPQRTQPLLQVVIDGFAKVYSDWVNDYGVDGFRIDTAKHVNDAFLAKWWAKVTTLSTTKPKLFAFGEVYDSNPWYLSSFVRTGKLPSVLDFNFKDGALDYASGGDATSLSGVFAMDDLYTSANTSAYNLATFLGNHDMGRVAHEQNPIVNKTL